MAEVIGLHRLTPAALAQYLSLLDQGPIDRYSQLIAQEALPALRREVEASLRPALRREVCMAVAVLARGLGPPPSIEDPAKFGETVE